jgi:SAM-dependent methyltransferase
MLTLYGRNSSLALGWLTYADQSDRFKALANIGDMNGKTVLDAGCGYGDLLPYLRSLYDDVSYTGIEQIPELLAEARNRYGNYPNARFIAGNFMVMEIPEVDYVLASGCLNYRSADPDFIFKSIATLYEAAVVGFGFNLLSNIIPDGLLVAYDQRQIVNYCRDLCNNVKLVTGYADDDFTIYMYR